MVVLMMSKEYNFRCTYKKGEHHCNGSHLFELNDSILPLLSYYMIFRGNLTINKEMVLSEMKEFETYLDGLYLDNENKNGEIFRHFTTIDIQAELIHSFVDNKYE